jgi:hypothetical protein
VKAAPDGKAEHFIQTTLREWAYARRLSKLKPATVGFPARLSAFLQLADTTISGIDDSRLEV